MGGGGQHDEGRAESMERRLYLYTYLDRESVSGCRRDVRQPTLPLSPVSRGSRLLAESNLWPRPTAYPTYLARVSSLFVIPFFPSQATWYRSGQLPQDTE